ncbi:MAG: sigma-54 dependent transcriptional regulator [Tissierellia bacterium]|nr:sigma-54 dependent transcriptional regulator [Tissierellia bacterium]
MKGPWSQVERLMDDLGQGYIEIDKDKRIRQINTRAMDMLGLTLKNKFCHGEGQIKEGDLVILADNVLGNDDGGLRPEDFRLINIKNKDLRLGDCILAIGTYKKDKKPHYKYYRNDQLVSNIKLESVYEGQKIEIEIQKDKRVISISLNGQAYPMSYQYAIGHMILLDGETKEVKFIQAPGYSIRREALKNILQGDFFQAKPTKNHEIRAIVLNSRFDLVSKEAEFNDILDGVLKGQIDKQVGELQEINKRLFLCDLIPMEGEDQKTREGLQIILHTAMEVERLMENKVPIIDRIERHFRKEVLFYREDKVQKSQFLGTSAQAREVRYLSYKAGQNKFTVLLTGESGTGKSMMAREIHGLGGKKAPFVEVHCNAISRSLFESELFGYEAGAFTGSSPKGKKGYFEKANGGTIFLDEIGEIPLDIQVKLLQALENKVIYPVGSSQAINIDVRIIVATNKDLEEEVAQRRFRQDLFYRINIFPIPIPPLRERGNDVYSLSNDLLNKICQKYGVPQKRLSHEAMEYILSYGWPGNVRELENCMERAVVLCETNLIYPEHLNILHQVHDTSLGDLLDLEEKRIIERFLLKNGGDRLKTAQDLKISKSSLYGKIAKYAIKA